MTNLKETDKAHQNKIKEHVKTLLKSTHSIWSDKTSQFTPTARQQEVLDKETDSNIKNITLAKMEREFNAPREEEMLKKIQLRKILQEIRDEEIKKSSRSQICAEELNYELFQNQDKRQKVRMEAQKCSLDRMKNEQDVNRLGIELAKTQQTLLQCINAIQPRMALSLGLKNLVRTAKIIESLDALNYFNNSKSEEMLDTLQHNLLDSIAENTSLLAKRRTIEHHPASPPRKLEKKEEEYSLSESEYSSEGEYSL